ncbi:hypothetical protein HDV03_002341 [Kappamyces sp. JEL0829]|nr:hypothetical protein HDV03_002341 [Kappamyces sp. JEL0829]
MGELTLCLSSRLAVKVPSSSQLDKTCGSQCRGKINDLAALFGSGPCNKEPAFSQLASIGLTSADFPTFFNGIFNAICTKSSTGSYCVLEQFQQSLNLTGLSGDMLCTTCGQSELSAFIQTPGQSSSFKQLCEQIRTNFNAMCPNFKVNQASEAARSSVSGAFGAAVLVATAALLF